jgi:hypothetical protein
VTAPNYLPWGGTHLEPAFFADNVLQHLPETLDFGRFRYDKFIAEGTHAVALITIGITGTPDIVQISEHLEVSDGLAQSIWVAYFQPQPLLTKLHIDHGLPLSAPRPTPPRPDPATVNTGPVPVGCAHGAHQTEGNNSSAGCCWAPCRVRRGRHMTWRRGCGAVAYGPTLAEGCILLDGLARIP